MDIGKEVCALFGRPVSDGADNQEETTEGGVQRLCGGIVGCLVVAPLMIFVGAMIAGLNERNYLCKSRAINEGFGQAVEIPSAKCGSAAEGANDLVIFACDLNLSSGEAFQLWPGNHSPSYSGTGLRTDVEMYQCVETAKTKSSTSAGGKKRKTTTYTYSKAWRNSHVDSGAFAKKESDSFKANCGEGVENPSWEELPRKGIPSPGIQRSRSARVDAFKIGWEFMGFIQLSKNYSEPAPPQNWTREGHRYATTALRLQRASGEVRGPQIGDVRVAFRVEDPEQLTYTVLGLNGGPERGIRPWTARDSWGCSGFTLSEMRLGSFSVEDLRGSMESSKSDLLLFLRVAAFALIWFGLSRCAAPCHVVAECFPFVGEYAGAAVECAACAVACCPAMACCLGVASVVYIALRPQLGIPMMLFFLATAAGFGYWKFKQLERKRSVGAEDAGILELASIS